MKDKERFAKGAALARRAIRRRKAVRPIRAAAARRGLLLAEGDSWFDYPFFDVLEMLEDHGYETESVAHRGDNLEDMAHDEKQLDRLTKAFSKFKQRGLSPKAVLLSGGGNDIAGDEFPVLLNHKNSGLPVLNEKVVEGLVEVRLRQAMASLLGSISTLCQTYLGGARPILIHGYDYPVPDGRGYMGGAWILPGPWLEPGFRKKGHVAASKADRRRVLAANAAVMRELIERYNAMLKSVARSLPGVHYVDLRNKLSTELARDKYREDWNDELHPTKDGFRKVALAFARVLGAV